MKKSRTSCTEETAFARRRGFHRLLDRPEGGDVLVVTKLDCLGRDAIGVSSTVAQHEEIDVKVHGLALGGVGLAGFAGKTTMNVVNAAARRVTRYVISSLGSFGYVSP